MFTAILALVLFQTMTASIVLNKDGQPLCAAQLEAQVPDLDGRRWRHLRQLDERGLCDAQFGRRVWGAHHAPGVLLVTVFDALPELAHVYFTVFALVRYVVLFFNLTRIALFTALDVGQEIPVLWNTTSSPPSWTS